MELLITQVMLLVPTIGYLLAGGGALIAGVVVTYFVCTASVKRKGNNIIKDAEQEAEMIKQRKMLQAKEKFLQLKADHEKMINDKDNRIAQRESVIKQSEYSYTQKQESLKRELSETEAIRSNLTHQLDLIEKRKEELDNLTNYRWNNWRLFLVYLPKKLHPNWLNH